MFLYGLYGVYLRELLILKRRFKRYIFAMAVAPTLYIVAFGTAMGDHITVNGHSYLEFLFPGLIAMGSMTQSYSMSSEINVARFNHHIFDEFQCAPIANLTYVIGEVLAGITRAFIGTFVLLAIGAAFNISLHLSPAFWIAILLNAFAFASLAVCLAMVVRGHTDLNLLNNFIITPMAFLGGTFFPIEKMPDWAQTVIFLLPLPHASQAIRSASFAEPTKWMHFGIILCAGICLFALATKLVNQARD